MNAAVGCDSKLCITVLGSYLQKSPNRSIVSNQYEIKLMQAIHMIVGVLSWLSFQLGCYQSRDKTVHHNLASQS